MSNFIIILSAVFELSYGGLVEETRRDERNMRILHTSVARNPYKL
jgi:hypothetical protein